MVKLVHYTYFRTEIKKCMTKKMKQISYLILFLLLVNFTAFEIGAQNNCNFLCNSDFEDKQFLGPNNWGFFHQDSLPCWRTTASDNWIEIWSDGNGGVPSYSGNQFIELNANQVSTLFQNFTAIPGSSVKISFAHRGRSGNETISVSMGPVGGAYVPLDTFTTGTSAWAYYTVSYTFPNNGVTNYSLRFNSLGGGSVGNFLDAISIVLPKPEISFVKRNDSCGNASGRLNATVTNGTAPYTYLWSNNSTATFINNLNAGIYSLRVSDAYGCADTLRDTVRNIRVSVLNSISVNNDEQCLNGNRFNFSQSNNWNSTTYDWNFDDATTSSVSAPIKLYSNFGNYNVRLIGVMHLGCRDTLNINVTVLPSPNALFTINNDEQCLIGNLFTFNNQSNIGQGTMNYVWYFGNGDSSISNSIDYSYSNDAIYDVTLIASSLQNCKDTAFLPVIVHPNPNVDFSPNFSELCFNGNNFTFNNNSSVNGSISLSYMWNFGDNQSSQLMHPTKQYLTHGNFIVQLIGNTNFGCADTISKTVEVFPSPIADFVPSERSVCFRNHAIYFNNNSTISYHNLSYIWDLGDGNNSTLENPLHTYNNANRFNVSLIVNSEKNCADTVSQLIDVFPMPVSSFVLNTTTACLNENSFNASNTSSIINGTFNSYWYNSDMLIDSTNHLNYRFSDSGFYWVQLVTVSNFQCKDTSKQLVRVNKNPISLINSLMPDACFYQHQLTVNSNVTSFNGNYDSDYFLSDLSQYTNTISFTHQFTNADTFTITQIVTDDLTCADTNVFNVVILPQPKSVIQKNEIDVCLNTNSIELTDLTIDNGISYNRTWQIVDENTTRRDSVLNYHFNVEGLKKIYLLVEGSSGCNTLDSTELVINPNNNLNFWLSNDSFCFNEQNFEYRYNGTINLNDLNNLTWFFGDATTSNNEQGTKIYTNVGVYNGLLITETDLGCLDTGLFKVEILANPIARINVNDSIWCLNNQMIDLVSTSTSSQGNIISYNWSMGDNTFSQNQNVTNKRYNNAGIYPVSLSVQSSNTCKDTTKLRMKIFRNPEARFTLNQSEACLKGNRFILNNNSQYYQNRKQNYWIINSEGIRDSGNVYNYVSSLTGIQSIQMISIDQQNCADTINQTVLVHPQSEMSFITDSVCFRESNSFISGATVESGVIEEWRWLLGDGSQGIGEQVTHTYNRTGTFTVHLITRTDFDCLDTLVLNNIAMVRALPISNFTYQKVLDSMHVTGYNFYNNSESDGMLSYWWNFNQVSNSSIENPFIRFQDTGLITVTLTVTDEFGCEGSVVKSFINYPVTQMYTPNAFSPNDDEVNDVFKVEGVVYSRKFKLEIFNRWGELLFETSDLKKGWDGKYQDKPVSEGVYLARVFYQGMSGEIYSIKTTVTLLR